ncbi:hypothetical protein SAMN05421640_3202 [Ekhidna lutea]|uniref:Uncharacterized protein n=1 Tax=Ekhidna lutea TaxID=447679 RepID=A0A239LEM5_EKHLU|nr:hypothetical protein [Ekhidna lutea]SNT28785.1 hypothetical protein SAMN05421640_3202 [Ekhidna lutea]
MDFFVVSCLIVALTLLIYLLSPYIIYIFRTLDLKKLYLKFYDPLDESQNHSRFREFLEFQISADRLSHYVGIEILNRRRFRKKEKQLKSYRGELLELKLNLVKRNRLFFLNQCQKSLDELNYELHFIQFKYYDKLYDSIRSLVASQDHSSPTRDELLSKLKYPNKFEFSNHKFHEQLFDLIYNKYFDFIKAVAQVLGWIDCQNDLFHFDNNVPKQQIIRLAAISQYILEDNGVLELKTKDHQMRGESIMILFNWKYDYTGPSNKKFQQFGEIISSTNRDKLDKVFDSIN